MDTPETTTIAYCFPLLAIALSLGCDRILMPKNEPSSDPFSQSTGAGSGAMLTPSPSGPAPTGDALADKIGTVMFEHPRYYRPTSALLKQKTENERELHFKVTLPGSPYCHAFAAAGPDKVKRIDIRIESPSRETLASGRSPGSAAVLGDVCPLDRGEYSLTVSTDRPGLELAVQVFSARRTPREVRAKRSTP